MSLDMVGLLLKVAALQGYMIASVSNSVMSAAVHEPEVWLVLIARRRWNDFIDHFFLWLRWQKCSLIWRARCTIVLNFLNPTLLTSAIWRFADSFNDFGPLIVFLLREFPMGALLGQYGWSLLGQIFKGRCTVVRPSLAHGAADA